MASNQPLSRNGFLKLAGAALAAALLPAELTASGKSGPTLGRVVNGALTVFEQPSFTSRQAAQYWQDMVLPIARRVNGESSDRFGPEWWQIGNEGYAHAAGLQPVQIRFQEPVEDLRFTGSLAEVAVPFVDVYQDFSTESLRIYRYYYGSTHWVNKLVWDREERPWYRVYDDKFPERERWAPADRLHVFTDEELAPISPEVPAEEKRIEVYLEEQRLAAFEGDSQVFEALVSTGDYVTNQKYQTPKGSYLIWLKRPSQHMMPWDRTFGSYDLPGVPWVSYFAQRAVAFHGAYWHNAFGRIRSHGCVNLTPEDARWIYLWSTPVMQPFNELQYAETGGTRVVVI